VKINEDLLQLLDDALGYCILAVILGASFCC